METRKVGRRKKSQGPWFNGFDSRVLIGELGSMELEYLPTHEALFGIRQ